VAALLLLLPGCGLFGGRPKTLAPAAALYEKGEGDLLRGKYEAARESFQQIVEYHPDAEIAPLARLLVGEADYRDGEFDRAAKEFTVFLTLHPRHAVADLAQYRLARSYFDQMPALERDQTMASKALAEFRKLLKEYPESRYAPDGIVKIEACRLRLAQKELSVADYYQQRGHLEAALQRYDAVLKEYARTTVVPEALFHKLDLLVRLGRAEEASDTLRRLVQDHPGSTWSQRARERHAALL
jgi:outer membrane protein assembly factor BamD